MIISNFGNQNVDELTEINGCYLTSDGCLELTMSDGSILTKRLSPAQIDYLESIPDKNHVQVFNIGGRELSFSFGYTKRHDLKYCINRYRANN